MTIRHALNDARAVADELARLLEPHCELGQGVTRMRIERAPMRDGWQLNSLQSAY